MGALAIEAWHAELVDQNQDPEDISLDGQMQELCAMPVPAMPEGTLLVSYIIHSPDTSAGEHGDAPPEEHGYVLFDSGRVFE